MRGTIIRVITYLLFFCQDHKMAIEDRAWKSYTVQPATTGRCSVGEAEWASHKWWAKKTCKWNCHCLRVKTKKLSQNLNHNRRNRWQKVPRSRLRKNNTSNGSSKSISNERICPKLIKEREREVRRKQILDGYGTCKRKPLQCARSAKPKDLASFANNLDDYLDKASPQKSLALDGIGMVSPKDN